MLTPEMISGKWSDSYQKFIVAMKPGLNEMIVHLSVDNDEMQAIAGGVVDYGSGWRQKDLDYITSAEFKQTITENNIILITWEQNRELMAESVVMK